VNQAPSPAWEARTSTPGDAHGLAVLLLAAALAAGTMLPQFRPDGTDFPPPAASELIDRPAPQGAGASLSPWKPPPSTPLNLNTAGLEALQRLPGIGPTLAERIVADRRAYGLFRTPEHVLRVPGIGPRRWERIRPLLRVTEGP
jgi:competence ComEA-like helix-hairpin-helix protein